MDATGQEDRRRDRRLLRWLLLAVLVTVLGLYGAAFALASERLPRGTTIAGVDVGGLHPEDAERELKAGLKGALGQPIPVVVGERQLEVSPRAAGLEVDIEASVAQVAVGRSWSPADMWETLVGGFDHDPVVTVDEERLAAELDRVADRVETPAVEGAISFGRAGAEPVYPEVGRVLDRAAVREALVEAVPSTGEPIVLELVAQAPQVTRAEVARAMKEFANPAMAAPVTYVVGGEPVVLEPARYARALAMEARDGRLEPVLDGKRLRAVFRPAMRTIASAPQDATIRIVDGRPRVVPAKKGVTVDFARVRDTFLGLAAAPVGQRTLEMETSVAEPEFTTAEARALGVVEKVSEFTTSYPHADYRNTNIGRAAALVDGTLLKPGEVFSLNRVVGERTRENGFTEGFIISNGVFKEELGGGVSQVATTTFNAAFFAGLEDVEHKPHSFYIDRYPVGREATVAWPSVDLKFRNDTPHGVLLQTLHAPSSPGSSGAITVRMWSTKIWDITALTGNRYAFTSPDTRYLSGDDCVPNEGYGGFQIDVTRVFRRAGESEVERREVMHTTYTPSDSVVCRG